MKTSSSIWGPLPRSFEEPIPKRHRNEHGSLAAIILEGSSNNEQTIPFMSQIVRTETIAYEIKRADGTNELKVKSRDITLAEEIEKAVEHFLFPYITNQITAEEEKKQPPRGSLSGKIYKQLYLTNPQLKGMKEVKNQNQFQELVLNHYISCAAKGLYTNSHLQSSVRKAVVDAKPITDPKDGEIFLKENSENNAFFEREDYLQLYKKCQEFLSLYNENPRSVKLQLLWNNAEYVQLHDAYQQFLQLHNGDKDYLEMQIKYIEWIKADNSDKLLLLLNKLPLLSKPALVFLNAIVPAIKIDFPNLKVKSLNLTSKALDILQIISDKRTLDHDNRVEEFNTELNRQKNPNAASTKDLLYHKIQLETLDICLKKGIASLPSDNRAMYLSDLPDEVQRDTLKDPSYLESLKKFKRWCKKYNEESDVKLTKEAFVVLFEVLEKISSFKKISLTLDEIFEVLEDKIYN